MDKKYDFSKSSKLWRENQKKLIGEDDFKSMEAERKRNER